MPRHKSGHCRSRRRSHHSHRGHDNFYGRNYYGMNPFVFSNPQANAYVDSYANAYASAYANAFANAYGNPYGNPYPFGPFLNANTPGCGGYSPNQVYYQN
jgi:hypothetical protein